MFYDIAPQGLSCCSDLPIELHWLKDSKELYLVEYLTYKAGVFGLDKNPSDVLPRKVTFNEILAMGNAQSNSSRWTPHDLVHHIDKDEYF